MRILLYTDNHFCSNSSIVRQKGTKYSLRIENQLKSIDWAEELALQQHCEMVVCLGDFFDKPTLNDEELTAINEIHWSCLPHYFIVGNHESSVNGLMYNSTKALERQNFEIVDKPIGGEIPGVNENDSVYLHMLPYCIETDRKPLKETLALDMYHKNIVLSHNDVKGIQMGPVVSKDGYSIDEIDECCDLFINGHLHNGTKFSEKGINLGNLTGQNFGEDAFKYPHCAFILDTNTLKLESYENPYAFNFYKLEINSEKDLSIFNELKSNAIVSIKCLDGLLESVRQSLEHYKNKIVECRITTTKEILENSEINIDDLTMDHLAKFVECCKEKIDNTIVLDEELAEICH